MVKSRKYVVVKHFEGMPKKEDFEIVEHELPPLKDGQILVKTEWISVEPYQRAYNNKFTVPFDQYGFQIGLVENSRNPELPIGCRVISHKGWCTYSICKSDETGPFEVEKIQKLPDLKGLSPSLAIGVLGFPGATAYYGLLEICKPKAGETIVVSGAAGGVGSIVGQIAKIKGCRVIGFAGSDEKIVWLENELGFDVAINYKTADVKKALRQAAPNGVDCYFDNVGGELSGLIINQMNEFGRVSVCGSISTYNQGNESPKAIFQQMDIITKQLKIEGFLAKRWMHRFTEAFNDIIQWIQSGDIKVDEHITEGFEHTFDAFVGMLAGENIGKAMVKV